MHGLVDDFYLESSELLELSSFHKLLFFWQLKYIFCKFVDSLLESKVELSEGGKLCFPINQSQ